ncbi:flavin reductase [Alphaproteobacteria bacterium KMM 3653]|uniref:Flavin reductase n=1 Tax=Harenicola maris TaxID=2841044 RepID=A0AAP2G3H9_9RHOB|nr:flavin reductase [Harenicola maris]
MTEAPSDTDFSPHAFRRALGNFATGVTIVTAVTPEGEKVGVTASSFNSLSMDPPLILWSSMKDTLSCAVFEKAEHFAVNILASDQMEMSNHFARQNEDKFAGVDWEPGIGGSPLFPNTAGRFQCESYAKLDGGDHWIFVGKVLAFDDYGRAPLCFHQGSYSMVFSHPATATQPEGQVEQSALEASGRYKNHTFFQMLQAVRAYQDHYRPKLETQGLSVIEARVLLVLSEVPGLTAESLVPYLNAPLVEAQEALSNLTDRGMISDHGSGFATTESGRAKATDCWNVAQSHAEEAFAKFSEAQMETFTEVLQGLIEH